MRTSRRHFFSVTILGIVTLAGCTEERNASTTTGKTGNRTDESGTKTTGTVRAEVPPCPQRPEPLTREKVTPFVMQFEQAYRARLIARANPDLARVEVEVLNPDDELVERKDGWVLQLAVPDAEYGEDTATDTGGGGGQVVGYYVTENALYRSAGEGAERPSETGERVTCPPE